MVKISRCVSQYVLSERTFLMYQSWCVLINSLMCQSQLARCVSQSVCKVAEFARCVSQCVLGDIKCIETVCARWSYVLSVLITERCDSHSACLVSVC